MKREELRLELVKLTYTFGRGGAEAVGMAKILEAYILEEVSESSGREEAKEAPKPSKSIYRKS